MGENNKQPYKFGGKEYITAKGYNIYDFGGRGYDPSIGAGAAAGAFLVIEEMGMTAFGASQVAIGLAADPTKENKKMASELPQSITDIGGIVADKAVGNQNGEIRSAVQISSTILSAGLGYPIETTRSVFWGSLTTSGLQTLVWGFDNLKILNPDKSEAPLPLNKKSDNDSHFEENQ